LSENLKKRYFVDTFNDISSIENIIDSHYGAHYITAYNIFLDYPILGVGQNNFRNVCSDLKYSNLQSKRINDRCSTHPHNYYFQILSDLGIFNFILFILMIYFIFIQTIRDKHKSNMLLYYGKIVSLLVVFWPLLPTGSFYNNWLSSVNWLIIAICLTKIPKDYSKTLFTFLKNKNDAR
jgi:Lipid A core - O-antigen ligase and related enzymes